MTLPGAVRYACLLVAGLALTVAQAGETTSPVAPGKYNVLFIAVDDLKPRIGCYGDPLAKTPNMDRLAAQGTVFDRAYCQQAVCSPSRTSLMTGLRPDTTRVYDLNTHFRLNVPDAVTLPQHFKSHGYHAQAFSKIFHGPLNDPLSWSVPWDSGQTTASTDAAAKPARPSAKAPGKAKGKGKDMAAAGAKDEKTIVDPKTGTILWKKHTGAANPGPAWKAPDVPDNALRDGQAAEKAVAALQQIKDKRFFLAVGFLKPHLPFIAPKKYFDMYPLDAIRPAANPNPPIDVPPLALTDWGELRKYEGMPKDGPVDDKTARELIRGYYAAASYADAQIGKLLDEMERLGLRDNTVVILWGDHGWQLGEHGLWCKHTNFEEAARAPLIVSVPGQKHRGAHARALVEFVDIYPTLCELCGLRVPEACEGSSLAPLIENPSLPGKKAAFSQYPRPKNNMGYSMRTDKYRYTEWTDRATSAVVAAELYDHEKDPGENVNLANQPDKAGVVRELKAQLQAGWQAAKP